MFLISENILSKFKVVVNRGNVIEMQEKKSPENSQNQAIFQEILFVLKHFMNFYL